MTSKWSSAGRSLVMAGMIATGIALGGDAGAQTEDAVEEQVADDDAEDDGGAAIGRRSGLEEIVVTARKREEALVDTPVAVTALGAQTLRDSSVHRIDQMREMVPNLNVQQTRLGNVANFSIRGVGTGSEDIQFDPGVAVYLDGVFLPRASGSLLNVVDVEQIEVLRGPQGTLFGKNSVGGAINITTIKPQPEFEGFLRVRPGNFNAIDSEAMLNAPVVEDILSTRVTVFSSQRDGYVHNSFLDEYNGDADELSFLGSLRLTPTDDLTFDLSGMWNRSHTSGNGGQCRVVRQDGPVAPLFPTLFDECRRTSLFEWTSEVQGLSDIESAGVWGVANYEIGDAWIFEDLAIKGIGSWHEQTTRMRFDVDGTSVHATYLTTAGPPPLEGAPGPADQTSGELQINGTTWEGRLAFVSGLFAQWEQAEDHRATIVGGVLQSASTLIDSGIDNWTWAPYVQATAEVIPDWLSLTGGIRYTEDKKGFSVAQTQPFTGAALGVPAADSKVFSQWTPMASVASTLPIDLLPDWTDHAMAYFTYSQGFKGGGFNALPGGNDATELAEPFDPETVDNFEIGFKTIFLDRRLTLNTAFFHAIYDDIQKVSVVTSGQGQQIAVNRVTENAAKATVEGFEIEMQALPIDGLLAMGNIGFTDATYDDFRNAISDYDGSLIDRSGETFNYVPQFTSFLALQYGWPIDVANEILQGELTPRLEWYYQSENHLNGPEIAASEQSGYNLLNARLSYDFWDARAQIALWGRNLADQEYIIFSTPTVSTFGTVLNYPGLPRTFGAELSYRFN